MQKNTGNNKISIIGGGPAGCFTAYLLAKAGKAVNIFEEHNKIGSPVQCTGIVTSSINNILNKNNIKLKKNTIINKIHKARIYSQKNFVEVNLKNPNLILDRKEFDQFLSEKAEEAGAKINLNHRFIGNDGEKVITSKKTIHSKIIIGADGPLSRVAKVNNMFCRRKFWQGIQARVKLKNENIVEFYPNIGTFAWVVPESKDIVRIGIIDRINRPNIKIQFNKFLENKLNKNQKTKKSSIIDYQGGLVPVYNPKQITKKGNIYLLGDAACQVKATTAGGIIQSLTAAEALTTSITKNRSYEREWKKKLSKDLWLHLKMRKVMDKFSENDLQYLIMLFNKKKNKAILNTYDRDYPSKFLLKMIIREPRLLYFIKYLIMQ